MDQKKNEMNEAAQAGKPRRPRNYNRRRPARKPAAAERDGLWSGTRDILDSPELRLDEALPTAAETPAETPAETIVAGESKPSGRRPGRPKGSRNKKKPTEAAAVATTAAPAETAAPAAPEAQAPARPRRGRKPAAAKAPAANAPAAKAPEKSAPAKAAPAAQPAAEPSPKPRSGGKGKRNTPAVVSAADSIVRDADILRHVGGGLRVRRMGGELAYIPKAKLRIIPLGGLNEIGKNMTVIEYGEDIVVVDCGIGFPDEDEMPGIDLVIPDVTYLENNRDQIGRAHV